MTRPRLWIALVLAGATFADGVRAQDPENPDPNDPAAEPARPTQPAPASGNTPADSGAASAFGTPAGGTPAPEKPRRAEPLPSTPAAPEPGMGPGPTRDSDLPEPATTFSVPGVLGRPTESYTVGQGRLARPRFRFTGSFAVGIDDNIFGTPTKQQTIPEQRITVVTRPEQDVQVPDGFDVAFVNGIRTPVPRFRTERQPAETQEIVLAPAQPTQPREASIVSQANVGLQVQFASRRTLFTLDSRLGAEYVTARETDPIIYSGSLGVRFVHKVTPRLQWNASVDGAYTQQPDFSRINTPFIQPQGNFLDFVARTGLSYRWTPRISAAASLTYRTILFQENTLQNQNFNSLLYSLEGRYLFSPRFTTLGEVRFETVGYDAADLRNSNTQFYLAGADWVVTPRLNANFRAGVSVRASDFAGTQASPYLQLNVGYRLPRASQIAWTSIYGFEEPPNAGTKLVTFRNGISYAQYFSPRLRAVAGSNIVYSTFTDTLSNTSFTQLAFDLNLGLEYNINRRWTFTSTYSYSTIFSDNEFSEFYRNRFLMGFQFAF